MLLIRPMIHSNAGGQRVFFPAPFQWSVETGPGISDISGVELQRMNMNHKLHRLRHIPSRQMKDIETSH